ncbi:hypothetical protein E2C01_004939 [Portunus trituberculatus]|uniref:Uncharacterized protein n=1 Tax=Portunus trituberculatus TaxID=210409 RepID=A0A5B7CR10_PORTR|nr:hypothetical protein [Portunus trituberculatus]
MCLGARDERTSEAEMWVFGLAADLTYGWPGIIDTTKQRQQQQQQQQQRQQQQQQRQHTDAEN